jgi:hypothetical protein
MCRFDRKEKANAREWKEKVGMIPKTGIATQAPEGRQIITRRQFPAAENVFL